MIKRILALFLISSFILPPSSFVALGATGCTYPTTLDTYADKATENNLAASELNNRACAIEAALPQPS